MAGISFDGDANVTVKGSTGILRGVDGHETHETARSLNQNWHGITIIMMHCTRRCWDGMGIKEINR